jgi:hypothetical protein
MTVTFDIHRQWESALHEAPEVRHTAAMLRIVVGDDVVTRNEDEWAQTVRDDVRLSAYPLALWLASSWWRLRWEPLPISRSIPSRSWRMAHEMSAAGYGYIWPRMLFASDGECISVWAAASRPESKHMVRYLASTFHAVGAQTFERVVDDFISGVLARLDATKVDRTALYDLWMEISGEREERKLALQRRFEAVLGFDPDECPESLLRDLENLIPRAGESAVEDIVPVCASADPAATLTQVLAVAEADGVHGHIGLSLPKVGLHADAEMPSWLKGRELARRARASLGLNGSAVSDAKLCDALGLSVERALNVQGAPRLPLSLAVRKSQSTDVKFVVRKRNKPGRRFELARFLCDYLTADERDKWLPVSDAKTSRQRTQRAFAAEFLCPIQALEEFMSGDFSADMVEEAAEHFAVAPAAVQTQLVNNRLLPATVLSEYGGGVDLPYFNVSAH